MPTFANQAFSVLCIQNAEADALTRITIVGVLNTVVVLGAVHLHFYETPVPSHRQKTDIRRGNRLGCLRSTDIPLILGYPLDTRVPQRNSAVKGKDRSVKRIRMSARLLNTPSVKPPTEFPKSSRVYFSGARREKHFTALRFQALTVTDNGITSPCRGSL